MLSMIISLKKQTYNEIKRGEVELGASPLSRFEKDKKKKIPSFL
jgi:hypothetical protein